MTSGKRQNHTLTARSGTLGLMFAHKAAASVSVERMDAGFQMVGNSPAAMAATTGA